MSLLTRIAISNNNQLCSAEAKLTATDAALFNHHEIWRAIQERPAFLLPSSQTHHPPCLQIAPD